MKVLGFSVGHDKGAVIIEDGKVIIGIRVVQYHLNQLTIV